jgi:outer membrane protein TolC
MHAALLLSLLLAQPAEAGERTFAIDLPTALRLAHAKPLDIALAAKQIDIAARQYDRARVLWVPNLTVGLDYFRHEGGQQNFAGEILRSSRGTFTAGVGPNLIVNGGDAIYAPLAARQDLFARQAMLRSATNDLTLQVAEAYFHVQQARGELSGALQAVGHAEEVAKKAAALAEGLAPPLESTRAKVELARRKQDAIRARERWRTAGAELTRLLRLEPGVLVEPSEPPELIVTLVPTEQTADGLIPIALANRPELQAHQAVVAASLARLKQEKLRPLVPSLALRSTATNPSGSIGYGYFAGGPNDRMANGGSRFDIDVQLLWEFSALGLGNRARVGERKAEYESATLDVFRTQDRIAAEVVTELARSRAAAERLTLTDVALKDAADLVKRSLEGMTQTRRVGEYLTLVVRPLEVVAAVQALATAYADHFSAVGDFNRSQFRLYRALGHPAQSLSQAVPTGN